MSYFLNLYIISIFSVYIFHCGIIKQYSYIFLDWTKRVKKKLYKEFFILYMNITFV